MFLIDELAEARIAEAMERGDFDHLEGAGRPLSLDDDLLVPEHLRVAFRILKNAGYLPPELELRREISELGQLLQYVQGEGERTAAGRRLRALMLRLSLMRGCEVDPCSETGYLDRLASRFDGRRGAA
jgi:hypothetical protein